MMCQWIQYLVNNRHGHTMYHCYLKYPLEILIVWLLLTTPCDQSTLMVTWWLVVSNQLQPALSSQGTTQGQYSLVGMLKFQRTIMNFSERILSLIARQAAAKIHAFLLLHHNCFLHIQDAQSLRKSEHMDSLCDYRIIVEPAWYTLHMNLTCDGEYFFACKQMVCSYQSRTLDSCWNQPPWTTTF